MTSPTAADANSVLEERQYQAEAEELAVASLMSYGGFALFMEQRTGKTVVACKIVKRMSPTRLLIVGPQIAQPVWNEHIDQHHLISQRLPDHEIVYITRDMVYRQYKKLRRWIGKAPDGRGMVIADEGHDYKDPSSKRSRGLRLIGKKARWRLLLTGTPQESGLEDYWAQFDFVDDQLFGEWADFKAKYLVYGGFRMKQIVRYKEQNDFQEKLHSRSYRVLLEDVKPVKTDIAPSHEVRFDLIESREAYRAMEEKFIVELNKVVWVKQLEPDGTHTFVKRRKRVAASLVITQAMKLHQLSGGFIKDEDGSVHHVGDEKLLIAGALCLALGNVPQVFFVRFLPELRRLGALLTRLGRQVTYISGKHKGYVSGTPFDVAVVQIASGQSIDLAHAEEAVFYSWDYSYLKYDQAKFRIRSYHGRRARYHYLIARGTIDEVLYGTVIRKTSFAQAVIDKYRKKST